MNLKLCVPYSRETETKRKWYYFFQLYYIWKWKSLSCVWLFATMQSIEFSRPEYWSGSPFPSPGHLPNPGIEPRAPALQVDSLPVEPPGKPTCSKLYLRIQISCWCVCVCALSCSVLSNSMMYLCNSKKHTQTVSKQSRKTHSPSLRQWFPLKTIQTPWDSLTSMEVLSLEPALLWAVPVSVQNSPYNSYQKPDSLCLLVFVLLDLYFASYFR